MDIHNLIISGHSFGGVNALENAFVDDRIKYLLTLDPWVWAIHEVINKGEFTISMP